MHQASSANRPAAAKAEPLKQEEQSGSSVEKRSSVTKPAQHGVITKNQSAPVSPTTIEAHSSFFAPGKNAASVEGQGEKQAAVSGARSSVQGQVGRAVSSEEDSKAEKIRNLRQSFVNLFE